MTLQIIEMELQLRAAVSCFSNLHLSRTGLPLMRAKSISLGAPAAERDNALRNYFVESTIYKDVEAGRANVLIGNRGSGKSAIFRILAEREAPKGTLVIQIAPEDYSYEMMKDILKREIQGAWAKQGAYNVSWKYVITVLTMKALSSSAFGNDSSRKKISSFLRLRFQGQSQSPIDWILSYMKRIETVKIMESGISVTQLQSLYKLEDFEDIRPYIADLLKHNKVLILVDELDRGWDASEDARQFVAGLFQAAIQMGQTSPNLRVLISLRRELYDNIPEIYEDAQKVRDLVRHISWDEAGLKSLIAQRIKSAMADGRPLDADSYWTLLFEETLDYRRTKSFNYIVDRTLFRPREMILFCTECIDSSEELTERIDYEIITKAEARYSKERVQDIAAEYRFQFPGLMEVFETFRGMVYNFSRDELENHCVEVITNERKCPVSTAWLQSMDEKRLIATLWDVGFIRALAVGGQKGIVRSGSRYVGQYQLSTLSLDSVPQFHIHPMFRSFLGSREK